MTKEELEQIEVRANAMSNGRWEYSHNGMMEPPSVYIDGKESIVVYSSDDDAKCIAHARTDIPALIAEIRRLQRVIAQELSENDELGAEYTYVRALKDENARMREALECLADEEAYNPPEPSDPITGYFEQGRENLWDIARKALAGQPQGEGEKMASSDDSAALTSKARKT